MTTRSEWSRILIVENHPDQLDTLVKLLNEEGYHVVGVPSIAEALECAKCEKFAVAVINMPVPDAFSNPITSTFTGDE